MDLARTLAERDHDRPRRPAWVTAAGVLLAIAVVAIVGRGFDAFLGGFQRLLERIAHEEAEIAQEEAEAQARKPQPIFVVPPEPPAGAGPDEAQPPAD
jgi:hypothetical protein